jgi:hypothetical protein
MYLYKPNLECALTPSLALIRLLSGHFALAIGTGNTLEIGYKFAGKGGPNRSFNIAQSIT